MPTRTLLLGTNNQGKLKELRSLLKGVPVRVVSLSDFAACPEAEEIGRTFEANARIKARAYSRHSGSLTLADDSGLLVDALHGKPGVLSARFAGENVSYLDNNVKLLRLLKKIPASRRTARFVSSMALYDAGRPVCVVKGVCEGAIAPAARGNRGFGYDPVFIPAGFSRTFAELSPALKNRISHRGRALRAAKKEIRAYLRKTRTTVSSPRKRGSKLS